MVTLAMLACHSAAVTATIHLEKHVVT